MDGEAGGGGGGTELSFAVFSLCTSNFRLFLEFSGVIDRSLVGENVVGLLESLPDSFCGVGRRSSLVAGGRLGFFSGRLIAGVARSEFFALAQTGIFFPSSPFSVMSSSSTTLPPKVLWMLLLLFSSNKIDLGVVRMGSFSLLTVMVLAV